MLTNENTDSDLNVHALYASDIPFKNFCKLARHIVKHGVEWSGVEWSGFVKHGVDL